MAKKLVNMKIDKAAREKRYAEPTVAGDSPEYPWGLALNLDDEALDALGEDKLPAADTEVLIMAKAKVTNVGVNDSTSGKRRSMSLQITDLAIEIPDDKKTDKDVLFKG